MSRTPTQPWLVRSQPAGGLSDLSPTCPTTIGRAALRTPPAISGGYLSAWYRAPTEARDTWPKRALAMNPSHTCTTAFSEKASSHHPRSVDMAAPEETRLGATRFDR